MIGERPEKPGRFVFARSKKFWTRMTRMTRMTRIRADRADLLMPIRETAFRRSEFQPFYYQTSPSAFIRSYQRSSAQSAS
jgi:hypothetical protein